MALLAMAIWDTVENGRSVYTHRCLKSLYRTVDWSRHRLVCVDNNSCQETKSILKAWQSKFTFTVIENNENVGQARAINQAWQTSSAGEGVARIDNDVYHNTNGWLDILEEVVARDPKIGIAGCKRKDIPDSPNQPDGCWSKTSIRMLAHDKGQSWLVVEPIGHVLGTCLLTSAALFKKIGYLYQFGAKWGHEDVGACLRAKLAGFECCYVPQIDIDHMDPLDDTPYQQWKNRTGTENMATWDILKKQYISGERPLWHSPGDV